MVATITETFHETKLLDEKYCPMSKLWWFTFHLDLILYITGFHSESYINLLATASLCVTDTRVCVCGGCISIRKDVWYGWVLKLPNKVCFFKTGPTKDMFSWTNGLTKGIFSWKKKSSIKGKVLWFPSYPLYPFPTRSDPPPSLPMSWWGMF